jgi:hypothetical protein
MIKKGLVKNASRMDCGKLFITSIVALLLLCSVASAATVTYRFLPSNSVAIATGISTNYGNCGANPTAARITELTTASTSGCGSSSATGGLGAFIDLYSNTAYSTNTNIAGQWYYGRIAQGGSSSTAYTFNLIYAYPNGTVVVLPGSGTVTIASNVDANYNVSLTSITGSVPSGAKLGLRISKSATYTTRVLWFGDSGGVGSVASGYFAVDETSTGGGPSTYDFSGYITDTSSGLPIIGATVQTNTSQSTTTNSQGYYNFPGLSNGTYNITATFSGYSSNFTIKTINGDNVTNANISLSPVPTYLLSGYVTNQSSGAAISGATVQTNTSQSITTNAAGYYNFTVSNGSLLITASKSGYTDNSITRTVNGAAVSNANISLTPVPPAPPYSN